MLPQLSWSVRSGVSLYAAALYQGHDVLDALDFLANEAYKDPALGIDGPLDFKGQRKIVLPSMSREHLAVLFERLGYRRGVEVGVFKGHYSEVLLDANPDLELFCVDPWQMYVGYDERQYRKNPNLMRDAYREALDKLTHRNTHILRQSSMDAVKLFGESELDFCYIDGNHEFRHVADDIGEWSKRVKRGGIIAGHDFARFKRATCHVKAVVGAWTYSHNIKPWFVLRGKRNASWFWVKK
jgi:hypothetical protein